MSEIDKSYEESIASDIFNMIQSAKESGLDMNTGFQNEPLSTPKMAIRYLFYGKQALAAIPMPQEVKKRLKTANVLGMIALDGRPVGVHLLCAFAKPFADIQAEQEVLDAIQHKSLGAFAAQLKELMAEEFKVAESDSGSDSGPVH